MGQRTTSDDVKDITLQHRGGDSASATLDFSVFIEVASIVTDRVVSCAGSDSGRTTLTDQESELVERYLAAHFWAVDDQQFTEKKTERASAKFMGVPDKGFESTTFGQQAIRIDPSGCLAELNKPKTRVRMNWLGKEPSSQTHYTDRN